jgi:formylglycine-generating enzyme required for sulfatase activity
MSQPAADRNLLFGILALQMDFLRRDDLIAAMNAWVLDKARPLGQILREQGKLAADEEALLDGLVRKHLEKHGDDPRRSLAAVTPDPAVRDGLRQIPDPDVQASLGPCSDPTAEVTTPHAPAPAPSPHGRYRVLRPHARGGLGEVFVARDEELHREVALKEIQARHAHHAESRSRFLLEAEVTAGLEHPGIVPVYGLGTYADGRPFYAMRLVKGDNLKDAIARFHQEQDRLPTGQRTLRLRELLGRFVDVCQAVAYAHSRGVLHRDLKPGNVMLGQYGETLVVDWGLAKVLDRADADTPEGPLRTGSGDSGMTQAGTVLGTPAYVSPEQAAGRLDRVGPPSDVYNLGATLYCLLTGRPPFAEGDVGAVLGRVQRGDFLPPRQVSRQVPAALDAVCRKAMALRPEDRYASPRDLADEVERWLADEPVRAYREPAAARLARWARRHQTLTVAAGVLLLTAVTALAVSTFLVGRAQRETARALDDERQARRGRALAQVDALLNADPRAVPALLTGLEATRDDVLPRLHELWAQPEPALDPVKRGRVGLALLPVEPETVRDWLYAWMLRAEDPREMLLVRDGLRPHQAELRRGLWERVEDPATAPEARFRALAALAAFDPDDDRWGQRGGTVAGHLLQVNSLHLGTWAEAVRPVRGALIRPLTDAFHGRQLAEQKPLTPLLLAEHKQVAAQLLADYVADRPDLLADLALDADARQCAVLLPRLVAHPEPVRRVLEAELARTPAARATDAEKDALAFRQANAAVTLLHLGEARSVWPLLAHAPDPSRRTYLTHHLAAYGIAAGVLLDRLPAEADVSARRALLLALGEYAPAQVSAARRQELVAGLVRSYRDDPDPGLHGAAEWLLRRWGEDGKLPVLRDHRPKDPPAGKPTWYVNGQGQTMTVLPGPVEFTMGSPEAEPDRHVMERMHRRTIPRSFSVAAKPVTVAEFRRFLEATPAMKARFFDAAGQAAGLLKRYSPDEDGPVILLEWYVAAAYCNWLSKEEGIPEEEWCYPKDPAKFRAGMVLEEGYLGRHGYRLPTEAEREYACRAGAVTSRFYGTAEALLGDYAWFEQNSGDRAHPVGRLRPNDLGLFDVLGNAAEWCQEAIAEYPPGDTVDDAVAGRETKDSLHRVTRGGAFSFAAIMERSARRNEGLTTYRGNIVGLRVARTEE